MIIIRLMGGMGNQMFQYALGRQLSIKHKVPLKVDLSFLLDRTPKANFTYRNYDLDVFNTKVSLATKENIADFNPDNLPQSIFHRIERKLKGCRVVYEKYFHYDPDVLNSSRNSYLCGYWQSEKYFSGIREVIKKEFTLKNTDWQDITEQEDRILSTNSICVNFRRADFVNNPEANKFHGVCEMEYYTKAIELITKKVEHPMFFIFSDDIKWCKENVKIQFPHYFIEHKYAGTKFEKYLHLMTKCKHFIISNSTFAWWGVWLCDSMDKVVIAPQKWFNDQTIDTTDMVPSTWIRI